MFMKHVKQQQGSALIMALIFLAMTAIISSSVLNTGVLELKMVGNAQFQEEAFQATEGVLDAIVANYETNLPVVGGIGYTVCATGSSASGCNQSIISVPTSVSTVPSGVTLDYRAERLGPLLAPLPFRQSENEASSAGAFNVAIYEINANYDGRSAKLGYHDVFEGVAIRVAAAGQQYAVA